MSLRLKLHLSIKVKITIVLIQPFLHQMFLYSFFKTLFALHLFDMFGKLIPIFNTLIKERTRLTSFDVGDNKI